MNLSEWAASVMAVVCGCAQNKGVGRARGRAGGRSYTPGDLADPRGPGDRESSGKRDASRRRKKRGRRRRKKGMTSWAYLHRLLQVSLECLGTEKIKEEVTDSSKV